MSIAVPAYLAPRRVPFFAAALGVLLCAEIWLVRARFNTDALAELATWWAPLVRALRFSVPWTLCAALGVLLAGGPALRADVRALAARTRQPERLWPYAAANVLALAIFIAASSLLLEHGPRSRALDVVLLAVWAGSGACIPMALLASVVPLDVALATLSRARRPLAFGALLGSAGFSAYSLTETTWPFWRPLASGTVVLAHALLSIVYEDCTLDGFVIATEGFSVVVTKYCSGYEGIGLFLIFFTAFLLIFRDRLRFPNALWLLPLGSLAVWLLNAVRVAGLVVVGREISPQVAVEGFHVYAGWPLVACVALGSVALAARMPAFAAGGRACSAPHGPDATSIHLLPLLAIVATALVTGAFTDEPQSLYGVRVAVGAAVLLHYRRELRTRASVVSPFALVLGVLAWALWTVLGASSASPWDGAHASSLWILHVALGCIGSIAVAPLAEELAFRGFLARRLASADFESVAPRAIPAWAWVLSSVAFGLVHEDVLAACIAGGVYAFAYFRRGRLVDAVAAHATTNVLLILQASCG